MATLTRYTSSALPEAGLYRIEYVLANSHPRQPLVDVGVRMDPKQLAGEVWNMAKTGQDADGMLTFMLPWHMARTRGVLPGGGRLHFWANFKTEEPTVEAVAYVLDLESF